MAYEYDYPRPAVSVDICVFRAIKSTIETHPTTSELLLIERKNEPFAGFWALPGGFLDEGETLESAAIRELREETGLNATNVQQVKAYSHPDRDPRTRVISVAFVASISDAESPIAADDAARVGWFNLNQLPLLAFDHQQIVKDALTTVNVADPN